MDSMLAPLMRSPRFARYLDTLNKAWAEEQVARQKFRDWVTPDVKAEFINGEIIVHSPARYCHNDVRLLIGRLLSVYAESKGLGKVLGEKMMVQCDRNDYEPDVNFWRKEQADRFEAEQMFFPPPALVVEVLSPTTKLYDRGEKFDDYAANGIEEYWIVDPISREVEQFVLRAERYQPVVTASGQSMIRSVVLDGLETPVSSFFDAAENLKAVTRLLT